MPFAHELLKLGAQVVLGFEVGNAQAFALKDAEPLFYLIHPGAMHRREVDHEAGMVSQPGADELEHLRGSLGRNRHQERSDRRDHERAEGLARSPADAEQSAGAGHAGRTTYQDSALVPMNGPAV